MPATSKAQARFMGAVAGGSIHKKGLPPSKAKEFVRGVKVSKLPERAKGAKRGRRSTLTKNLMHSSGLYR